MVGTLVGALVGALTGVYDEPWTTVVEGAPWLPEEDVDVAIRWSVVML